MAAAGVVAALSATAFATDVKTAGQLNAPKGAALVAICTDPIMQNVFNEDLRATQHNQTDNPDALTITVNVSQRLLAPGASLTQLFPGDPEMVKLLKAAGADPPPLGDTGNQPIDPFANEARRRALNPDDPLTAQFKDYQSKQQQLSGATAHTPYDDIPKNELYDTIIAARASLEGAPDEFKVVAVVHSGDDVRRAKELVAEEIVNSVLH
ncbi:MAG TPA: hypothetical protein VMU16_15470 [Candidatus Binataceae bacterium]|nr:hypothetical protein [Candidatus Binataceae bacterium]